jgi:hypothetical protein
MIYRILLCQWSVGWNVIFPGPLHVQPISPNQQDAPNRTLVRPSGPDSRRKGSFEGFAAFGSVWTGRRDAVKASAGGGAAG